MSLSKYEWGILICVTLSAMFGFLGLPSISAIWAVTGIIFCVMNLWNEELK